MYVSVARPLYHTKLRSFEGCIYGCENTVISRKTSRNFTCYQRSHVRRCLFGHWRLRDVLTKTSSLFKPLFLSASPTSFSLRYIWAVSRCLFKYTYVSQCWGTWKRLRRVPVTNFECFQHAWLCEFGGIL